MCAYLNNSSIVIDAILTRRGRSLLSKGEDSFKITKFALGDSEIDYSLWNTSHPMGTDYYGIAIESLPILEAVPDEAQMMKYKLVTLSRNTTRIPIITVSATSIELTAPGDTATITPNTSNYEKGNSTLGYTAILSNSDVAYLSVVSGKEISNSINFTAIQDYQTSTSVAVTGFAFEVVAKNQAYQDATATITIIGNETGGRKVVNLTVKKSEVATISSTL